MFRVNIFFLSFFYLVWYAIYDVETSIALKQEEITMTVGENIRRIRQERHLTQRQLGEMVVQAKPIFVLMKVAEETPNQHLLKK